MPTPAKVESANGTFIFGTYNSNEGQNTVHTSPPHKLSSSDGKEINYSVVIDPVTKEQKIYERTYIIGALQRIDPNKAIAVKGPDGTFLPTEYASKNLNESLVKRLQEDTAQATFENVVDYTVKSALKQTSRDGTFTPVQVAEAKGEEPETPMATDNQENSSGGDGETEPVTGDGSLNGLTVSSAANQETVKSFAAGKSDLVYPEGAIGNESDYMKFTALKYLPGTLNTSGGSFGTSYQSGTSLRQSVQLPIQGGIQDSNAVGWNEDTMNVLQAAGAEIATEFIGKGVSAAVNTLLKQAKTLSTNAGPAKTAIKNCNGGSSSGI